MMLSYPVDVQPKSHGGKSSKSLVKNQYEREAFGKINAFLNKQMCDTSPGQRTFGIQEIADGASVTVEIAHRYCKRADYGSNGITVYKD
jgi:hypothetical protein